MNIKTVSDLRRAFRNGPFAWPGGYPCFFIMADGEALSFDAAKAERRQLLEALSDADARPDDGWLPVALDINWEDASLFCAHTGERIPSAYAEDDDARAAEDDDAAAGTYDEGNAIGGDNRAED